MRSPSDQRTENDSTSDVQYACATLVFHSRCVAYFVHTEGDGMYDLSSGRAPHTHSIGQYCCIFVRAGWPNVTGGRLIRSRLPTTSKIVNVFVSRTLFSVVSPIPWECQAASIEIGLQLLDGVDSAVTKNTTDCSSISVFKYFDRVSGMCGCEHPLQSEEWAS